MSQNNTSAYERMRSGQPYAMPDRYLIELQSEARAKLKKFNTAPDNDVESRKAMLRDALGTAGDGIILSPVTWEYGRNIHLGSRFFINFDCVFLDGADIRIGTNAVIGPRVQFLTAGHPVDPGLRAWINSATGERQGTWCVNSPIVIGENCWIGAGTIVLGGVSIGDGVTVGAGSVVTRDIPSGALAAGNPCRVIRSAATDSSPIDDPAWRVISS